MKSKLEVYTLTVCFSCVICLLITLSSGGYSMIKILSPETTLNTYQFTRYQSNNLYWDRHQSDKEEVKKPSESELTSMRQEEFALTLESESREGKQSLIQYLIFIIVSSALLGVHWTILRRLQAAE